MNQMEVINALIRISKERKNNQITEEEAVSRLQQLIGNPGFDSLRWKVFEESSMMKTPISKIGHAHRKRLKALAAQVDPDYFGNAYWGEGL